MTNDLFLSKDTLTCRRCVVIIEDDQAIRESLKMFLGFTGYEVFEAENGKSGLDLLRRISRPGLILLDLLMPVMDGWKFMEELKKDEVLASIPVVIITAFADRAHEIQNKEILRKPLDLDALCAAVKKYCGEPGRNEVRVA